MEEKRGKPTSCWDEAKGGCLIWALTGFCAFSHWCQGARGQGVNLGEVAMAVEGEVWVWRSEAKILVQNTRKLLSPHPMVNSQICCCAYSLCILAFLSATTLEITVPQPGFSGFSFPPHVRVSFSQKTSLPCPGYSRNMEKCCQGLNIAVLGWGKKSVWVKSSEGRKNLWFWSKHPSFM